MEDNSRIDDFYNDLVQSGFTFGGKTDRASYDAMMADDARSKKLYGILTDRGWDLDDYDTWRNGFSSQSQPNTAMMTPQNGGENGNEFTDEQPDGIKDHYQTAQTPQQVQKPMNASRLDPKYQLNEDGSVKPYNFLEQEKTVDDNGNTQWKPKLVKGADGTDVYRNAMTGEEYNPLSPEAMENVGQNTMDPHQYEQKTVDPSWGETFGKSLGAGFTRAGAGLVDVMSQLTSGMYVDSGDGYIRTQSYEERVKDKNNPLTKASDVMHATADRMSQEAQPYGGQKGFLDLLWDGEIGKFAQKGLATAGESLPMTLSAYNPYTMVLNAISMAGGNYRDETLENPEIPAWKRATYAVGQAAIEQAVEKYADPVFKYIGGSKGKEVAEDITKEATESIAKRIYNALGGLVKDAAGEGAEEVITNFGNDALGEVLDALDGDKDYGIRAQWEKMKKENPDAKLSDFAMAKAKENVESFLGGALAGAYTSGTAQLSIGALRYAATCGTNQDVPDGVKLDPVTVEVAQSYDEGQRFEIPQEKNDAKIMYDVQRERMNGIVDEDTLNDIENDPVSWIVSNKGNLDADDLQTVLDYANAKATYDGMIQKVRDDIDSQCAAFDKLIDSRTNRSGANAGMLVPATMKMNDRQVFVIDGDIQMLEDGSMVDVSKSSESILVCDAETGKVEFVSPHDVMNVGEAVNAEEEKARVREDTTRQIAQEQADQMEGVLPFNVGDEYALVDDKGEKHTVKVIANSADPTNPEVALVSWDGGAPMPAPKEEIQKWSQQESRGRAEEKVAQKTAENAAANGAEVNGEAVAQPAVEAVAQPVAPVTETAESVQNPGENVINGGENVQQTGENVQSEPMPMIGEGDDAEPNFLATTPERGLSFLFGESGWEERDADDYLNSNVKASAKEVEKIESKRPKAGTNFAKFNKDMAAWNASKQEAEVKAKYWKQMKELRDAELAKQKAERDAAEKARQEAATDQAIAEEAAYAAEQAQKAAEQAELGSNNVALAIRDKWNNAQKTVGSADEIVLANGEKITGHYVLVDSGAASPSHNANNGFTKTDGFPVDENGNSVNDRDYERDQDAQRITRNIASRYDSRALQTPVVVSQDGVVLSGNGRTMAGEIAAADGTDGAYNQYVKDRAAKYGFTTEQVEKMQHPRVVFVPDASLPYTAETFAKFNQQEMKGQNKTEQAVKLGKVVDDATFNRIVNIIDRFDTLGEFYADPKASREAISELQSAGAISQAQLAEMLDGDGISAIGRDLLENMLVGKAFENNPDAVREISSLKSMRQSVIKALGEILNNVKLGEDYSLEEELAGAIDLVYKARKEGGYKEGDRVSGFARQMNLGFFGEDMTVADMTNVTMLEIADVLNSGFETRLKAYMQNYNTHAQESAAGQLDLFSGEVMSKEDILNDVNNLFNNGTEQETVDTRAEGVAEDGAVNNGGAGSEAGEQVTKGTSANAPRKVAKTSLLDVVRDLYTKGKEYAAKLYNRSFFDVVETPSFMKDLGLSGDKFTIRYGVISRHLGKDEEHDLPESVWEKLPEALQNPFAITKYFADDNKQQQKGYRIFTTIQLDNGSFVVVSAEVKNAGRDIEVNAINTVFGRNSISDVHDELIYRADKITPEQQALLDGNNPHQYPDGREEKRDVSDRKDSNIIANDQAQANETDIFSQNEAETESADVNSSPVAEAIAAAEAETDTNPSEAQKEAGNYKKGHVKVDGYDITIENPKGSVRSGKDADGKEWSVTMNNTYGYIRGTEGVDGDHIDVFLSDNPEQGNVYVVDQVDADGNFDEHKVMYGFGSAEEARDNYLANYSEGWKMGNITEVSKDEFKKWIESSHRKTKPFSEYKSVKKEGAQGEAQKEPTPQEARDWLNAKYDGQAMPTDGSSHAVGWIDNLSDEDALVMYRAETLGSDPTKTEDDAFEVFQYFDDIAEGLTPDESARPILEKYGKKFDDQQPSTAAQTNASETASETQPSSAEGESLKDYMQRNGDYPETKREYMVAKYGSEKVDDAVELFAEYNDGKAADIAQKLYDLGITDKDEAMAIYDFAFDKKYVHTPNTLPFIDAFFDLAHEKKRNQQPSTAAEEKETNVEKAIRIMKEIDDLSSELDELYTTGPEAEADRVSAEHMAKYGELEALEKSMTDEEKEALDKRLRDEVDDLDGEWAEWLEAGMKEEPVESTHSLNNAEAEKNQKPEKPEKPQKTSQRKPRKTKPSTTTAGDEKINDVGEKIGGARKDATLNYAKKIDLEATVPSKIFPKPNFASMEKAGVPHETLVKLKAYYTAFSITNKNKRKRNENQRILSARFYASVARDMLLRDVDVFNESADGIVLTDYGKQHLELLVSCVEALDKKDVPGFFDLDISDVDINIGEFKENENGAYQTKDGKRWVGTYSYGRTNNMAAVRYKLFALDDIEGLAEEYCKQVEEAHSKNVQNEIKIHVYRMSSGKCYISAKVKGVADEIKLKDDFSSSKEAFDYIRENGDALRTEARAKADEMKQSKKNGGGTRKPTNDDIERMLRNIVQGTRIGKDYRNGKDVSAEDFMKEFGFRGVEFGNWATQKERQDHLNACYDALMDLADLIGISPKAISLGGKLAMAFGSRGHSSALAHYEPAKHVINLTKEHGAGCVAHEWFHAIDNYFGGGVFGLRMKSAVESNSRDNMRSEMQKIFAEIGRALNGSDMKVRSKKLGNGDYWASTLEMAARAFESYVNERLMARGQMNQYLSAHVPGEAVQYEALAKNDPYPTAEESKKFGEIFDRLFDTVQEEVGDDGNVNLFQIADVEPGTENVTEAQQLATEAIITALGENAGLDVVMESQEKGQRVAAEQNADTEMMALSNNEQEFDSMKKMAHDEKGHVLPGLAEKTVTVVPLSDHGFGETFGEAVKNAKEWAKSNLAGKEYDFPEGGKYVISNKAIGKYLSSSAFTKSDNSNVHLAALRMLPEIIGNSMDAEIHEDYKKGEDGKRNVNNGVENENKLVHRLYGAVTLGDKTYRVKTTMYEYRDGELKNNTPHSYEITEIELLDSPVLPAEAVKNTIGISNNSISGANLLKNVEKSYDNGVKILENQQNTAEFMQVWHGSAAVFDHFDGAFMGSGEGSQVYGDGHYVTGVESTGRMYATIATENRQRSNTPIVRWKGQQVDFSSVNPLRLAHDVADSSRTIKEARDRAERYADMAEEQDMKTNWKLALDILKQSTKADFKPVPVNGNRQLYEVEIPDDNGSNYLDWNEKATDEQLEMVYNSITDRDREGIEDFIEAQAGNEGERKYFGIHNGMSGAEKISAYMKSLGVFATGERLYKRLLIGECRMSSRQASDTLASAGFAGIKVPTGNRRGGDGRGTNYVIFNDNDLKITDRVQFMQRPEGTVYGWSEGNRIHLTPEGINPNTPIHEYTHLWARAVMQKNPKLWSRIKELLQGTPIWEEVVNDPAYQGLTTDDAIASEALSRLSGRKNAGKMEKMAQDLLNEAKGNGVFAEANAHTLILKMKHALKDFWKWVGTNLFDMTDVKNIDEVTDRVLYDLLNKTDLALSEDGDVATEFQVVTDDQINTPQFKKWFGDWQKEPKSASKVVDKNGEPLVVYHGTKGTFNTFAYNPEDIGFHFGNKTTARTRVGRGKDARLMPVYLDIKNPLVIDTDLGAWDADYLAEYLAKNNLADKDALARVILNDAAIEKFGTDVFDASNIQQIAPRYRRSSANANAKMRELLKGLGYDGIEYSNYYESNGSKSWIALDKSQIKSATENNGEFDAENADIRFRERTEFDDGEVIDIVGNRGSQDFSLADSTMPSYKTKEKLLHAFQEKHPAYAAVLTADGNGIEVTAWKSVLDKNIRKPRRRNGEPTKAEKQRAAYVERKTQIAIANVNEKAQKLGLNVEVITDTESLPKNMADKKGWYNKVTGKITIVLPNHSNGQDVMRTLMHEGVAHHGLRQMFGEDFNTFLDNVYANADIEVRRRIAELAARKGWDFHVATEEYLAALAEDIDFERKVDQSWWQKVKFFFIDMLRKAGIVLDTELTDNDLRYIVWKSYERMAYAGDHGAIRDARTVMMDLQLGTGNFGARAVADGSQVADGSELLYRDGEDEAEDSAPLSLNESMIQGLINLAEKNKENAAYKTYVVKAIGGELAKLRKAMSAQKEYDRSTVEQLTGLARLLIKNGMFGNMSEQEIMKLLTTIKNATGRNDITKYAQQIYDLMIKNQLDQARNMLDQVTRIKDSKVNAQGVEVQGQLDVRGQNLIKAFRKAMQLDEANINELLQNASDRMDSPDAAVADEAATEYAALTLAMQYVHDIKDSVADERVAKEELAQARKDHAAKTDGLSAKAFKEYVQEAEDAIRQKQLERIEAFHNLAARLAGAMQGSIESAKKFRERELERVKNIHHFANSDMQGRPANAHRVDNWKQKVMNNPFLRFLFNPLGTFDQMLRMIGNKSVNGEGYLYNHFMRGWLDATQKEFDNFHAACKVLDDKVSEVFGKKMRWSDLYAEERKMPKAEITFVDVDGSERTVELNQGNLLYIYMANKMADGRMKLRAMGIMEDDIENIKQVLDPRFVKLADWLQEEFLVNKRNDYNAVHERMFGAPMAAIENYFPLRILGDARVQQVDVAEDKIENELPSILTGSIIKRKTNKNPLDVMNTDAFSVVVEHLQQMEKWAAFAEWRRDLNTLLSYKRFRNQLKNMSSVYGAGNTLWRNFMIAGSIAAGTHRPKVDYDGVDTTLVNVAKGVTTAKIAFRVFTAIKQLLSAPAFMAESSLLNIGKSIATPWKAWNWAMEELPTFKKRWQSKQAGDSRLMKTDVDWRFWKNRLVDTLSRWGMSPNAFVDAMTVAIGGRAIYETKRARYIKDGYSEAEADKKAKQDAAVLVNQTQQSSETAFVSKMQLDRTVAAVSLSVFRNSSMSYQRQLVDSLRGLKRMATPGYKQESIDFMAKQMVRDGLNEDAAKRAATRAYNREWVRNISRTALFGFGMQMAWNLGAYLPYLIFGDDDDEKKEMLEDAAMHGLFGSVEGLSGGNVISELGNMKVKGESFRNYDMDLLPLMSEIKNIYTKFESDQVAAVNDIVNLLVQSGFGVNPQTITDAVVAITDACNGDVETGREATILFMRLAQAPQSQIDKLYLDELGMRGDEASKLSVQQLAERYADYKKKRGAPLMQWAYSDEQEKAVEDKYIKKFEKQAKERLMQTTGDAKLDDAYEAYEENYKDVKKRLEAVNKLKDEDFTEFYARMGELASTPEFTKYNAFKGYKTVMDNLMKSVINAKNSDEREGYLRMIEERKRQLVEMLDSIK